MKKLAVIIIIITVAFSCKNQTKQEVNLNENPATTSEKNNELITLTGNFIYYADAAVLQTTEDIYGVVIDDNMHKLHEQAKVYQNEVTDMVPVTVRVKKFKKPEGEEGWPFRVEIKEIVQVEAPTKNSKDVIKLAK